MDDLQIGGCIDSLLVNFGVRWQGPHPWNETFHLFFESIDFGWVVGKAFEAIDCYITSGSL